jgi:hypothetical protein
MLVAMTLALGCFGVDVVIALSLYLTGCVLEHYLIVS